MSDRQPTTTHYLDRDVAELLRRVNRLEARVAELEKCDDDAATDRPIGEAFSLPLAEWRELNRRLFGVEKPKGQEVVWQDWRDDADAMSDDTPPTVEGWLKAFGNYAPADPTPEPEKPEDPRSDTLNRALASQRVPDAYGR